MVSPPLVGPEGIPGYVGAGVWVRVAALLMDWLFLSLVGGIVVAGCHLFVILSEGWHEAEWVGIYYVLLALIFLGTVIVASVVYFTLYSWRWGQTPGKKAFSLKVLTSGYQPLSFSKAFLRVIITTSFLLFLPFVFFIFECLWAAWDEKKQALHDKLAGTYVVKVK